MKKFKFLSLALAALALGACSSSDDVAEGGGNESNTSYVAVNIMSVGGTTRAADYENGLGVENAIDAADLAFYFFDASGQPYQMTKAGGTTNKVVPTTITWNDQTTGGNTTRISDAILVLNGTTKTKPYSVVVVANTTIGEDLISLSDLRAKVDEYASTDKFVMSSSVYKSVCETPVGEFIKNNETDATNNPVDLFIERVSAKVVATIPVGSGSDWSWDGSNYKIKVGTTTTTGKDVYAVVKGWGVADSKKYSYLFKQVTDSWDEATIGLAWNDAANHRSYWATTYSGVSSPAQEVVNQSYNDYATKNTWGDTNPLYPRENTPTTTVSDLYNGNSLSKILLVAELQDGSGTPIEYCTYRGIEYLGEDEVKKQIAGEWASKYYYEASSGVYASIRPEDIIFKTTDDFGSDPLPTKLDKRYKVVAQLASTAPQFYTESGGTYTAVANDDVNNNLADEAALVRKGGAAYYYAPIKHLGTTDKVTEYGVVRNHVYKIDITDMKGFGTPVYDPDEKIIPETPDDTPAYLAAKINVLSWKIVSQSVSLDKTK